MEDFTLPSVGGSLKNWVHCAPILPKPPSLFPKLPKQKKLQKLKLTVQSQALARARQLAVARRLRTSAQANSSCPPFFAHVVSSLSLVPAHARPAQSSPKNFKNP
jgi:hypothetical protein